MLKTLTFVISAGNHPDFLARTVMLFHRMAIPIHALTLRRPTDDSNLRMEAEAVAEQSGRISAQLVKLIHVAWVETRKPDTRPGRGTRYAMVRTA
jgi:acetolactate synthase small subunit